MSNVFNLRTGKYIVFTCVAEDAVICAYEQSRGNFNTWQYKRGKDHPEFLESDKCVFCGDYGMIKLAEKAGSNG